MKLGVLFSGGKDSTLALMKAMEKDEMVCLITVRSKNPESYMFHTPNISIAKLQSEAIGLPLLEWETPGVKEEELKELKEAIVHAKKKYALEGLVTGAIASVYQASRIQKICDELGLMCINPLWQKDPAGIIRELLDNDFKVLISGVFAYPLDQSWLGKVIDEKLLGSLIMMRDKYKISPSGEGGEIETTVLDAPFFKKRIEIVDSEVAWDKNCGVFIIKKAKLVEKKAILL